MIECMESKSCKKDKKNNSKRLIKSVHEAAESQLNREKFNNILLNSFPTKWKMTFIIGGGGECFNDEYRKID